MKQWYEILLLASTIATFSGCEVGDGFYDGKTEISAQEGEGQTVGGGKIVGLYNQSYLAVVYSSGCTGTLVSPNVVVTARHCLNNSFKVGDFVYFGNNESVFNKPRNRIEVSEVSQHPTLDIAVVALKKEAPVPPMEMGDTTVEIGNIVRLVGFGLPAAGLSVLPITKRTGKAQVVIERQDEFITDDVKSHHVGSCPGDSGGAWLNSNHQLIGVHKGSLAEGKCEDARSVAIRISSFRRFIDEFIDEKSHNKNTYSSYPMENEIP